MNRILDFFRHEGYDASSFIAHKELQLILQYKAADSTQSPQQNTWRRDIFYRVWQSSSPNPQGMVRVSSYAQSIKDIHHLLNEEILHLLDDLGIYQHQLNHTQQSQCKRGSINTASTALEEQKISNLQYLIEGYQQDVEKLKYQCSVLLSQFERYAATKQLLHQSLLHSHNQHVEMMSYGFERQTRTYNKQLKKLYLLSLSYLLVEALAMMNKYGFLNLLFGFLLISIFHFSLFSHAYIIILLGLTVVSTLFDIGWLIVRGSTYWVSSDFSQLSGTNTAFLKLTLILVSIGVILKAWIFRYLWPWRTEETQNMYHVKAMMGRCNFTLVRSHPAIRLQEKLINGVFCGLIF